MKKIYIIGIVLALVFSITGCGIRETKNADKQESTVSTETKRQEPLRIEKTHKDGITYIQEQYLQYQIKYLAMDKKVISEEKIKEFMLKGYKASYDKKVTDENEITTEYLICGNNIQIPEIIEKNTTQKVVYTLYNFAGGLSKNEFSFSTDELEAMYQPSVEIEGESEQTVYLFFCIAVQSNGEIEKYYNNYKKDLESAVIQADITEVDGTEHTQYFGIRQKYETSDTPAYLELYLLEME